MHRLNLYAAWIGMILGVVSGAVPGLMFHREDWLGGYTSWPRRMVRLAHISFFGLGFINLAFFLTAEQLGLETGRAVPVLLLAGAVTMPVVCYLSAFRRSFRHLFPVPVLSVLVALALFTREILNR